MLSRQADLEIVGVAEDYDGLVAGAEAAAPNVVVTDIRMPPNFHREGIEACKEIRKRHPGTGIVILSQFDDPDYAIALLVRGRGRLRLPAEGSHRRGRPAGPGDPRGRHRRLDARPVDRRRAAAARCAAPAGSIADDEALLAMVAEGKPIKAIAPSTQPTPAAVEADVERLFCDLAEGVTAGTAGALDRLRMLHEAIVDARGAGRVAVAAAADRRRRAAARARARRSARPSGSNVTVLMTDIRGYSTIAEHADPSHARAAAQPPPGRDEPGDPRRRRHRDAVRRRRGDGRVRRPRTVRPTTPTARSPPRIAMHAAQRRGQRRVGQPRASRRSRSASGCRPATSPPRCSAPRSGSSTPSSATP